MKKIKLTLICLFVMLFVLGMAGCGKDTAPDSSSAGSNTTQIKQLEDGEYTAEAPNYDDSGYKATVKVTVRDGAVYSVDCDAKSKDGKTKKEVSRSGEYGMKAGGAQYEWHEEIGFFENYVKANGIDSVSVDGKGKTNVVTGCTIAVADYVDLINEALKKAEKK